MVADRSCLQAINEAWAAQRLPGVNVVGRAEASGNGFRLLEIPKL